MAPAQRQADPKTIQGRDYKRKEVKLLEQVGGGRQRGRSGNGRGSKSGHLQRLDGGEQGDRLGKPVGLHFISPIAFHEV